MAYGELKVDSITFTNGGTDTTVSVSGLVQNPTFSGDITVTGTISGSIVQGGTTVSGATVTGTAGEFGTVTGNTAGFTTVTGTTVTGTTASFTSGVFTNISGGTHTITSGVFDDGTAAAPSITFAGDLDTGIYSPGANQVAISTNGVERLRITSDGNVGLGTSSPDAQLYVAATASATNPAVRIASSGSLANNLIFRCQINGLTNGMSMTQDASSNVNYTFEGGNVGIGTNSVYAKFHVAADSIDGTQARITGATNQNYQLRWGFDTTNLVGRIQSIHAGTAYKALALNPDGGNVGVGTTTPSSLLSLGGSVSAQKLLIYESSNQRYGFGIQSSELRMFGDDSAALTFGHVSTTDGTTFSEKARIDANGRLLVGTTSSIDVASTAAAIMQVTQGASGLSGAFYSTANAAGPGGVIALGHGRNSTSGLLSANDVMGQIRFAGADGTDMETVGAQISAEVDGTPGANDMPGRLVFSTTADGSTIPTERMRIQADGRLVKYGNSSSARILPQTDNAGYIGQVSARWEAIYAVNGTIQTSDEREKTEIQTSELGSNFIRSLRPVSYKWKIGGYTSTWDDEGNETITPNPGVRTHYGFIAQEVKQACGDADFGGWLQEDLSDPESMQSLRLHEFISPIVKALQEALDEIDTLKAKVAALEAS